MLSLISTLLTQFIVFTNTFDGYTMFFPAIYAPQAESKESAEFSSLMIEHPFQGRINLTHDPILDQVANEKAKDMAIRGYFDHINPEGIGANYLVISAGFNLPLYYDRSKFANNIESLANGTANAQETFNALLESPEHKVHILGQHKFYAKQDRYGIGYYYAPRNPQKHFWVILTSERGK